MLDQTSEVSLDAIQNYFSYHLRSSRKHSNNFGVTAHKTGDPLKSSPFSNHIIHRFLTRCDTIQNRGDVLLLSLQLLIMECTVAELLLFSPGSVSLANPKVELICHPFNRLSKSLFILLAIVGDQIMPVDGATFFEDVLILHF